MEKLDQRIQLVASKDFNHNVDDWRREQQDLPSRSEAIRRLVQIGLGFEREHPMRMITAIIRPHKYEDVRKALVNLGIDGMTASKVDGFGSQRRQSETDRDAEDDVQDVPKLRVDVAVPGTLLASALEAIEKAAHTGKSGDGKLFVTRLDDVVRIRTGERNESALS